MVGLGGFSGCCGDVDAWILNIAYFLGLIFGIICGCENVKWTCIVF